MASLIERYVYDVVRRLPEKDREEVKRELTANIYDMLSEQPSDEEIVAVLTSLGSPRTLANKYRSKPNYLISPAVYYDYIRVLKWVVPLVGIVFLVIGMVFGVFEAIEAGMVGAAEFAGLLLAEGISLGVSGAFQALFWVTVGFIIADRTGMAKEQSDKTWTVEKLPEQTKEDKSKIPLSDSIAELIVIVVFSAIVIFFLLGVFSPVLISFGTSFGFHEIVASSFVALWIPFIVIGCVCGVVECIVKIVKRRWSPLVCGTILASNVVGIVLTLVLAFQPEIYSSTFISLAETQGWWHAPWLSLGGDVSFGMNAGQIIIAVIAALIVIGTLVESGTVIYKTVRASNASSGAVSTVPADNTARQ